MITRKNALEIALENQEGLTFDDVLLRTGYAKLHPNKVNIETMFSTNVPLKIPLVSAAMDTVTEYKLAAKIAELGGLGIIHKNLTPEFQATQVREVKRRLNGLIPNPKHFTEGDTMQYVATKINEEGLTFHTFPIMTKDLKILGILTEDSFEFCDDYSMKVEDAGETDFVSEPEGTTIKQAYELMKRGKFKALPLHTPNQELAGLYVWSDVKRIETGESARYNTDNNQQLRVGAAIGVGDEASERAELLVRSGVDVLVIDTAHADSDQVIDTLKEIKRQYSVDVVVGNTSTPTSFRRFKDFGADGIKIGQGPGSICTTRTVSGAGGAQITAIYECAKAARRYNLLICADGGLAQPGDITKAIAAGADSVMMGSMLAGTEEAPGEKVFVQGRTWKNYRGMGSLGAMQQHQGSRQRYNQEEASLQKLVPEGVEGRVPFKGDLALVINQYIGGLRAGMGYVGADNIGQLQRKSQFTRLGAAAQRESHPHNITITSEAPNYTIPGEALR